MLHLALEVTLYSMAKWCMKVSIELCHTGKRPGRFFFFFFFFFQPSNGGVPCTEQNHLHAQRLEFRIRNNT